MSNKNHTVTVGPTAPLLFVVFLVLKLTHVIDWSWWWVTAPLWIPAGVALLFFVAAIVGMAIGGKSWGK